MDVFRLDGKLAVVTGAAQGIGEAIARCLAGAGADLALCDRQGEALLRVAGDIEAETGRAVLAAELDVRDPVAVEELVELVVARFGRVDVLVNNAGGGFHAGFLDTTSKGEATLIAENFTSATHLIRLVARHMPSAGGSVVNVTTIEAHRAAPGYATYAAMKAALDNLSKSLAVELGHLNLRVNCVAPDMIPTPGIVPDPVGSPLPIITPLPYPGRPEDVAFAVCYLASDASRFVTGTTLHVDGGNLAAGGWRRQPDGTFDN